jgi:hypothetical protein
MIDEQSCATCAHRRGISNYLWDCVAVGRSCAAEMRYGGTCRNGEYLFMWEPRRSIFRRIVRVFAGTNATNNIAKNAINKVIKNQAEETGKKKEHAS